MSRDRFYVSVGKNPEGGNGFLAVITRGHPSHDKKVTLLEAKHFEKEEEGMEWGRAQINDPKWCLENG